MDTATPTGLYVGTFHPEYELHHVVATTGRYFVGDFIGTFEPGNLVLTGPNLPHNWISDVTPSEVVPLRNRVLQFTDEAIRGAIEVLPELQRFTETLDKSRSGMLFSDATSKRVGTMLAELVEATGIRRLELFIGIAGILHGDKDAQLLTSAEYVPDPSSAYMSAGLNAVPRDVCFRRPSLGHILRLKHVQGVLALDAAPA